MSLETRETKLFCRDIPGFCRDIPEVPEKFEKKEFMFNFRSLDFACKKNEDFRGRHGGVEKMSGVENLTNDTPPKKGVWTPSRTVRFPPPSGVSALFFLYKNPRQS